MRFLSYSGILGLAIFIMACSSGKIVFKTEAIKFVYYTAPGTIKIDSNLFADYAEVTNISYREYVYWNKLVFGENSEHYLNTFVDTTLWAYADSNFALPILTYLHHPVYNDFPVIGISYQQACDYCNWRSDRVMEYFLIKNKLISPHPEQDSSNYFTFEKYISGNYMNYKPVQGIPFVKYRLPSIEEWEKLASSESDPEFGLDLNSKKIRKHLQKGIPLFYTKEFAHFQKEKDFNTKTFARGVMNFPPNTRGLYDMIGNVAEMTSLEGFAKGGSWWHSTKESAINKNIIYTKAENWLGFRCVCSWEEYASK